MWTLLAPGGMFGEKFDRVGGKTRVAQKPKTRAKEDLARIFRISPKVQKVGRKFEPRTAVQPLFPIDHNLFATPFGGFGPLD